MNDPIRMRTSHFNKLHPGLCRAFLIIIPFFLGFLLILSFSLLYEPTRFIQIFGLIIIYFIPPAGKGTIIPAGIALGFPWEVICFAVIFIDAISCLFMLWNFDLICKIPYIGRWIYYIVQIGNDYLSHHHWIEKFCFLGLTTFVFLPLQGSGAVGGSILGRMLGMDPVRIFFAILFGSTIHSVAIGLSMYAISEYFDLNLWYLVIPILLLVLLSSTLSLVYYLVRKKTTSENSEKNAKNQEN
jgi:uncharacterized membrane protein